jgi:shikimate kinase
MSGTLRPSIALIGYRGSGKTTVGQVLADLLEVPLTDTDERIVARAGKTIAAIFAEESEAAFRAHEAAVIAALPTDRPLIISLGGGAVLNPGNVLRLRSFAWLVYLEASPEVLWERARHDPNSAQQRPALTEREGLDEVRTVLAKRQPIYVAASDWRVNTEDRTPEDVARDIADRWRAATA